MSIKKVTLASLLLLSLTACSNGSKSSSSNEPAIQPQISSSETEVKLLQAQEQLEVVKKANAQAIQLATESQKQLSELAQAKHDAEVAKQQATERLAEITKLKNDLEQEVNRTKAEIAAYEKAKQEAEALTVKKAEAERLEKERLAVAKYQEASGFSSIPREVTQKTDLFEESAKGGIYTQPHSVVKHIRYDRKGFENTNYVDNTVFETVATGTKTALDAIPNEGRATYSSSSCLPSKSVNKSMPATSSASDKPTAKMIAQSRFESCCIVVSPKFCSCYIWIFLTKLELV